MQTCEQEEAKAEVERALRALEMELEAVAVQSAAKAKADTRWKTAALAQAEEAAELSKKQVNDLNTQLIRCYTCFKMKSLCLVKSQIILKTPLQSFLLWSVFSCLSIVMAHWEEPANQAFVIFLNGLTCLCMCVHIVGYRWRNWGEQ